MVHLIRSRSKFSSIAIDIAPLMHVLRKCSVIVDILEVFNCVFNVNNLKGVYQTQQKKTKPVHSKHWQH